MAGCGGSSDDSQLSRSAAGSLRSDLDQIALSVREGNCSTAEQVSAALRTRIDGLGEGVTNDLRQALAASADRLDELVRDQCSPASEPEPVETPDPTQDTSQEERGNKEKQASSPNKPQQDKKEKKEKSKEVPPGQDGGSETTPPGQQDGNDESPDGDTGGASPNGG